MTSWEDHKNIYNRTYARTLMTKGFEESMKDNLLWVVWCRFISHHPEEVFDCYDSTDWIMETVDPDKSNTPWRSINRDWLNKIREIEMEALLLQGDPNA